MLSLDKSDRNMNTCGKDYFHVELYCLLPEEEKYENVDRLFVFAMEFVRQPRKRK